MDAVKQGCENLGRHIANMKKFGVPAVVAINHFISDTDAEVETVKDFLKSNNYKLPVVLDQNTKLICLFDVRSFPTTIVIDQGKIIERKVGVVSESFLKSYE